MAGPFQRIVKDARARRCGIERRCLRYSAQVASKRKVLVIDDNRDAAQGLCYLLEMAGYEAHGAHDGNEGMATAMVFRPDAVLLDLGLPAVDGYAVARRLRACEQLRDVYIIAVTGYASDDDRRRAKAAGIDHHVAKPAAFPEIEALLRARFFPD
jgi:DNA-binding response OmpR family regulator